MLRVSAPGLAPSTELQGNRMSGGAIHCTVARAIWPHKTAECWAVAAGVQTRMAKYWLAGRPVSDAGKLALIREID